MNRLIPKPRRGLWSAAATIAAASAPALAQVEFTPRDIFTGANGARSVLAADVDGDGDTDVLSASQDDNAIRWYENDGGIDPTFTRHDIFTGANFATSVFAADVDGDGDTDVLSASFTDDKIRWYENGGGDDPSFTPHDIITGIGGAYSLLAADMDGDGDMDVVSGSFIDGGIRWYENDGANDPSFTPHTIFNAGQIVRSIFATDVDGDGDTDLLSASQTDSTIRWYENDGADDPSFTPHTIITVAWEATSVYAADVDGDGDTDLLSASAADGVIRWYENDGADDPAFTARPVFTNAAGALSVFAADVDDDGDMDVLSASGNDNAIRWYENDGANDPSFTPHNIFTSAAGAFSVLAADADGDGDVDVLSASLFDNTIRWYENGLDPFPVANTTARTWHATIEDAIESASPGDDLLAPQERFAAEPLIDFTGKHLSLRSRSSISQDETGVYTLADDSVLATAPGTDMTLSGQTIAPVAAFAFLATDHLTLHAGGSLELGLSSGLYVDAPLGAKVEGDFDLSAGSFLGFSGDLLMPATGAFAERTIFEDARGANSVIAADLDNDGDLDLASGSVQDGVIRWYENDGAEDPAFTVHVIATDLYVAASVFAADMDADGDVDLLSVSGDVGLLVWHENDGEANPAFTNHVIYTDAPNMYSVFAADVDGDGDMDILTATDFTDAIRWYENDGEADPTFTPREVFIGADGAWSVFATDVDGDGDTDVLSASRWDGMVRWYENDGADDPAFEPHVIFSGGGNQRFVFAADLDGDGDTDVVSASRTDNTIRWYENDGAGDPAFTPHEVFTDALNAWAVFAADMDADGDVDILSASASDGVLRMYENDGSEDPTFTPAEVFVGEAGLHAVSAADVDGDGDTDILSGWEGGDVRWHERESPARSIPDGVILAADGAITNAAGMSVAGTVTADGGFINAARVTASGTVRSDGVFTNLARLRMLGGTAAADQGITNLGFITGFGTIDGDGNNDGNVTLQGDTNVLGGYTNNGVTTIQNGTLTILGALTNNGSIIGDFAGLDPRGDREGGLFIESDLAFGPGAMLRMASENARLSAGGDVDIAINSNQRYDMNLAELRMVALGGAQSLEVMSLDIGNDLAGLNRNIEDHYPIGTLRVGPTATTVNLVDDRDNTNDGQENCEAIYTRNLVIDAGATLNTNGCRVYYETLTLDGAVDNADNLIQLGLSCATDWDGNGVVNSVDVGAFLSQYFEDLANGTLLTDFDNNGAVNAADVGAFLSQYFEDLVDPECSGG